MWVRQNKVKVSSGMPKDLPRAVRPGSTCE